MVALRCGQCRADCCRSAPRACSCKLSDFPIECPRALIQGGNATPCGAPDAQSPIANVFVGSADKRRRVSAPPSRSHLSSAPPICGHESRRCGCPPAAVSARRPRRPSRRHRPTAAAGLRRAPKTVAPRGRDSNLLRHGLLPRPAFCFRFCAHSSFFGGGCRCPPPCCLSRPRWGARILGLSTRWRAARLPGRGWRTKASRPARRAPSCRLRRRMRPCPRAHGPCRARR
jgi:hypothetical protein